MMRLQLLALALVACTNPTPMTDISDAADPLCHGAPPVVCSDVLPDLTQWDPAAGPAPIPPFHSTSAVVVIFDSPTPPTEWAFAVDDGKITAWLAFPRNAIPALVAQLTASNAQVAAATAFAAPIVPQVNIIKPPVPTPPRLAAFIRQQAAYQAGSSMTAQADVQSECP